MQIICSAILFSTTAIAAIASLVPSTRHCTPDSPKSKVVPANSLINTMVGGAVQAIPSTHPSYCETVAGDRSSTACTTGCTTLWPIAMPFRLLAAEPWYLKALEVYPGKRHKHCDLDPSWSIPTLPLLFAVFCLGVLVCRWLQAALLPCMFSVLCFYFMFYSIVILGSFYQLVHVHFCFYIIF